MEQTFNWKNPFAMAALAATAVYMGSVIFGAWERAQERKMQAPTTLIPQGRFDAEEDRKPGRHGNQKMKGVSDYGKFFIVVAPFVVVAAAVITQNWDQADRFGKWFEEVASCIHSYDSLKDLLTRLFKTKAEASAKGRCLLKAAGAAAELAVGPSILDPSRLDEIIDPSTKTSVGMRDLNIKLTKEKQRESEQNFDSVSQAVKDNERDSDAREMAREKTTGNGKLTGRGVSGAVPPPFYCGANAADAVVTGVAREKIEIESKELQRLEDEEEGLVLINDETLSSAIMEVAGEKEATFLAEASKTFETQRSTPEANGVKRLVARIEGLDGEVPRSSCGKELGPEFRCKRDERRCPKCHATISYADPKHPTCDCKGDEISEVARQYAAKQVASDVLKPVVTGGITLGKIPVEYMTVRKCPVCSLTCALLLRCKKCEQKTLSCLSGPHIMCTDCIIQAHSEKNLIEHSFVAETNGRYFLTEQDKIHGDLHRWIVTHDKRVAYTFDMNGETTVGIMKGDKLALFIPGLEEQGWFYEAIGVSKNLVKRMLPRRSVPVPRMYDEYGQRKYFMKQLDRELCEMCMGNPDPNARWNPKSGHRPVIRVVDLEHLEGAEIEDDFSFEQAIQTKSIFGKTKSFVDDHKKVFITGLAIALVIAMWYIVHRYRAQTVLLEEAKKRQVHPSGDIARVADQFGVDRKKLRRRIGGRGNDDQEWIEDDEGNVYFEDGNGGWIMQEREERAERVARERVFKRQPLAEKLNKPVKLPAPKIERDPTRPRLNLKPMSPTVAQRLLDQHEQGVAKEQDLEQRVNQPGRGGDLGAEGKINKQKQQIKQLEQQRDAVNKAIEMAKIAVNLSEVEEPLQPEAGRTDGPPAALLEQLGKKLLMVTCRTREGSQRMLAFVKDNVMILPGHIEGLIQVSNGVTTTSFNAEDCERLEAIADERFDLKRCAETKQLFSNIRAPYAQPHAGERTWLVSRDGTEIAIESGVILGLRDDGLCETNVPTREGDCGAIYVNAKGAIVGVHIAADTKRGTNCFVPYSGSFF